MRISDWSSDVCSSDLSRRPEVRAGAHPAGGSGGRSLEQIRVGCNRRRRSTDPVNLLYPFEVDRIMVSEPKKLSSASTDSVQFCSAVRDRKSTRLNSSH